MMSGCCFRRRKRTISLTIVRRGVEIDFKVENQKGIFPSYLRKGRNLSNDEEAFKLRQCQNCQVSLLTSNRFWLPSSSKKITRNRKVAWNMAKINNKVSVSREKFAFCQKMPNVFHFFFFFFYRITTLKFHLECDIHNQPT